MFTGSGVASAKQTGHCGLNNCGLTATICSKCLAVLLNVFMPAWLEVQRFWEIFLFRLACRICPRTLQWGILSAATHVYA